MLVGDTRARSTRLSVSAACLLVAVAAVTQSMSVGVGDVGRGILLTVAVALVPAAFAWLRCSPDGLYPKLFCVVADIALVATLALGFESSFTALPGAALFAPLAFLADLSGSRALWRAHLTVSGAALAATAAHAIAQGYDTYAVLARVLGLVVVLGLPVAFSTLNRRLRDDLGRQQTDPVSGLHNRIGLETAAVTNPGALLVALSARVAASEEHPGPTRRAAPPDCCAAACPTTRCWRARDRPNSSPCSGFQTTPPPRMSPRDGSRRWMSSPRRHPPTTTGDGVSPSSTTISHAPGPTRWHGPSSAPSQPQNFGVDRDQGATGGTASRRRPSHRTTSPPCWSPVAPPSSSKPIHRPGGEQPAGYEALSRFPTSSPLDWFAAAARLGMGAALEKAAAVNALRDSVLLPGSAFLAVNLSPAALLAQPGIAGLLARNAHSRPLVVELTENVKIDKPAVLTATIEMLRAAGIRIALDDVGAGYAV